MKLLLFLLIFSSLSRCPAFANFSGITMTMADSPAQSMENIVDDVVKNSKLEEKMIVEYENVSSLKKALMKGIEKDPEVLRSLVKMRDDILPSIKGMSAEQQEQEYEFCQKYLKNTAVEFGYRE